MKNFKYLEDIASRCWHCKNAKCQKGCPIDTPISYIIELFQKGEYEKAGKILFENNPLSLACSIVCPFEDQCVGHCIRGIKGEPVFFPAIENFLIKKYLESVKFTNIKNKSKKIAIVGSGPAGISASFYLLAMGYEVYLFSDQDKIGGMLRYGIPDFRLDKKNVDLISERLIESGINFIGNKKLTQDEIDNLGEKFDAVLVATGCWEAKKPNIKGSKNKIVLYGIEYLKKKINLGDKKIVVIGAGNVAMDVSRTAKRQGGDVIIAYRKTLDRAPATWAEIDETKSDGVKIIEEVTPIEISSNGIILQENKSRCEFLMSCDNVIICASQISDIEIKEKKGYFYAGDLLTGPQTVVLASSSGKEVATQIDRYLKGE